MRHAATRRRALRVRRLAIAAALGLAARLLAPQEGRAIACEDFDHAHAAWSALLERRVEAGVVDYSGWKREDVPALDAYLEGLAGVDAACFGGFDRAQQIAFLTNAYNASTVKLILDEWPLESIRDIGFLPGAAFRREFIRLPAVGSGKLSLDDVEHDTLRERYAEPRIHFALVCAARSCPPLRSEAYRGAALDAQLQDQGRTFLRNPDKNRFDAATDTLELSRIFDWFSEDFVAAAGSVPAFVAPYLEGEVAAAARSDDVTVEYLDYDWSLNGS